MTVILYTPEIRTNVLATLRLEPIRDEIGRPLQVTWERFEDPRTADQNAKMHAMLSDIAKQVKWQGHKFTQGVWKRLCMAAWLREQGESPLMIPALDGQGIDVIYERTSKLSKKKAAEFIEWLYWFGAEHEVLWCREAQPMQEPTTET